MQSLQDVYTQIASQDAELEKQASELIKQAEEEDAAGRITARGFADELAKLASAHAVTQAKIAGAYDAGASAFDTGPKGGAMQRPSGTIKSGPMNTGGGNMGGGYDPFKGKSRAGASAGAAQAAGGTSTKPVGAPGPKPAKPPTLAAGAMKPPGA